MTGINLKNERELTLMREAGRIVAQVLARVRETVVPGMTTGDIEALAEQIIVREHKAIPSFKGYRGYPSLICTSVNDEIVHGIPGKRVLNQGDIVGVDVGVIYRGYQGDGAITVAVGQVDPESQRLMDVTVEALRCGIEASRPGNWTSDISRAIQEYVEGQGYTVVREYTGHGIGRQMHEDPQIPNYGVAGRGLLLKPGMVLAIEPKLVYENAFSAGMESVVRVTDSGHRLLTRTPVEVST